MYHNYIMKFIIEKIEYLRKQLKHWQYTYHTQNVSEISDTEYDIFLEELNQLESNYPFLSSQNSPTQCIGSIPHSGFRYIQHHIPMLSLNSVINQSQLLLFDKRIKNRLLHNCDKVITYCCELKLDGIAISLLYKQGKLIQASTRGDGNIGEDITKNVYTIQSIPKYLINDTHSITKKLPHFLEIRGEVFISKSCFVKLNHTLLQQGKKIFSNSRNAAAGSLRQLDSNITALRPLSFYCYSISDYIGKEMLPNSHRKRLLLCKNWGIPVNNYIQLVHGIDEALKFYNYIKKIRLNLECSIDGVVIKVDSCVDQNTLYHNLKAPNWAVAYKFPAESRFTKLNKIIFKVGRTGLITPIAYITPIIVDNVIIKKVNMHNINEIKRLGLMIGDIVRVQRSGDVIPKIVEVVLSKRSHNFMDIELPKFCPICKSILKPYKDTSSTLRCMAKLTCSAQLKASLVHFVSRKAMNIRGMGEKIIGQLVDKNLISTPLDIFYLNKEKLLKLDRFGLKSANRLLQSIDLSKKTTLSNFIYALGIPNVGQAVSKSLAITYKNIENLIESDLQTLLNLMYVGEIVAVDIYHFFKNPNNLKNVQALIHPDVGMQWIDVV